MNCPQYPCHFNGQDCGSCSCYLFPCEVEETGGKWIELKYGRGKIWDCSDCYIPHMPLITKSDEWKWVIKEHKKRKAELSDQLRKLIMGELAGIAIKMGKENGMEVKE